MSFRDRWILGLKILLAAQIAWLPIGLCFDLCRRFEESLPAHTLPVLVVAACVLGPLWAASLWRGWAANCMAQRLVNQVLASSSGTTRE